MLVIHILIKDALKNILKMYLIYFMNHYNELIKSSNVITPLSIKSLTISDK